MAQGYINRATQKLSYRWILALFVSTLSLISANPIYAQAVKGSLLGTITDPSGALIPGATVVLTEKNTNISRSTLTNESGHYVFSNLQEGVYRVEAELTGFKKAVRDEVQVLVNTTVRVDLALQVGDVAESITVTGAAAVLQTDRADTGRSIETKQLHDMPLGFGRNFQGLVNLVPGATRPFRPHSEFFNPQDSLSTHVNGQSRLANNVQIEGVDNNHRTGLLTVMIPPMEAIDSVSVTTSNYDAEFGRTGGAIEAVTLRSGTNEFHGSVFYFINNSATSARGYFSHLKAPTRFNQYGFTFGGPIAKNKLFFFGDYQGTKDHLGRVFRPVIPTMAFRNGDFSGAPTTLYDPATGDANGNGRQPFPNNIIPPERISPIARRIIGFIPAPTLNVPIGQINFEKATARIKNTDSFDVKVNYEMTDKDSFAIRYSFQEPRIFDPGLYGIFGGPSSDGFAGRGTDRKSSAAVNYTRTFSPTLVMEARAGLSRYRNIAQNQDFGLRTSEEIGIRGVNLDDFTSGLTRITIGNFSNPVVGFSPSLPWVRAETNLNFVNHWTKIMGNHTVKFGADVRRNEDDLLQTQDNGGSRGIFRFGSAQTALPTDSASQNGLANAFASFLLDVPGSIGRDLAVAFPATRHTAVFSFVQDKWQLSSRLTLDLGLRHEYYQPLVPAHNGGLSNYDPVNNNLVVAGIGTNPADLGRKKHYKNFGPRVGLAFRFDDKTVLRAGYGISYIPFPDNSYAFNFPVKQNNQFNPPNTFSPAGAMAAGFPAPILAVIPSNGIIPADTPLLLNQGFDVVPLNLREAYLQSWNLTFQRSLPKNFVVEIAYVANHGVGVLARQDINAGLIPGADVAGQPLFQRRGRRASANTWTRTDTHYNALQAKLDHRFSGGLLLTTSYTFGKATDYSDDNGGLAVPAIPRLNKARSNFDSTHIFVQSFIYDIPFGLDKGWLRFGPARWMLTGWQVGGIFTAQSGTPFNLGASGATLRAPGNAQRPNASGRPQMFRAIGPGALYFDTSVFSQPPPATYGNVSRNFLTGPRFVNLDASLFKKFHVTERVGGEIRAEAFNVTNTPHFNNPEGGLGNPRFGQVTGAFGERQFQFGLKLTF